MIALTIAELQSPASLFTSGLSEVLRSVFSGGLAIGGSWVLAGAGAALLEVAHMIGVVSTPNLTSAAFASSYLRVTALAVMLTLPFLFAAMAQAVLRGDFALLVRSACVSLPTALIAMSLAVPVVSLLLAVTDWMCSYVGGAGTTDGTEFLVRVAGACTKISILSGDTFLLCLLASLTVLAALALTVELVIREVAVYVVLLMTPLAFAAMVWPARRIWVLRTLELLLALILSKFVIVAVLSLAAAMGSNGSTTVQLISALALILLSCFAPWALVRLLPFSDAAAHAADSVHHGQSVVLGASKRAKDRALTGSDAVPALLAGLGSMASRSGDGVDSASGDPGDDWVADAGADTDRSASLSDPAPAAGSGTALAADEAELATTAGGAETPRLSASATPSEVGGSGETQSRSSPDLDIGDHATFEPGGGGHFDDYDFSAGTLLPPTGANDSTGPTGTGPEIGLETMLDGPDMERGLNGLGPDTTLLDLGAPDDLDGGPIATGAVDSTAGDEPPATERDAKR